MTDYETKERLRNIFVGIFVIVAVCALSWMIYKFGDLPTAVSKWKSFQVFVRFPTAPGVQKDTPIRFCGYQIGRVTKVMPPRMMENLNTGKEYHQTLVILSIDNKYVDIPSIVDAKLMTRGLGSSYVELKVDHAKLDPDISKRKFLAESMSLQGSSGATSEFFPEESQKKLELLATSLIDLVNNANEIIGDTENKKNLKDAIANFSAASKKLEGTLTVIDSFSASAGQTTEELGKAISQLRLILEKVNNGQGTAGKLINDARLYENLIENTDQLQILLGEIGTLVKELKKKGIKLL